MATKLEMDFTAENGNEILTLDLYGLGETIEWTPTVIVENRSTYTMYFRLSTTDPGWSPEYVNLGSVAIASSRTFTPTFSRPNPHEVSTTEFELVLEAFSDSTYTSKLGERRVTLTMDITDVSTWPDVLLQDFGPGSSQGWTFTSSNTTYGVCGLTSEISRRPTRSSIMGGVAGQAIIEDNTFKMSKTISIPDRPLVKLIMFYCGIYWGPAASSSGYLNDVYVKVNSRIVVPKFELFRYDSTYGTKTTPWAKIAVDLSEYRGMNVKITISGHAYSNDNYSAIKPGYSRMYLDDIIIAGRD